MRDKTPTMEVNNADTVTLDARIGRALREYLPVHFPQVIKYFTGQANVEEELKEDNEVAIGGESGEESFDEDGVDSAASEGGNSVESADARDYVVPSTPVGTTSSTTQPAATTNTSKTKTATTKLTSVPVPRIPLTPVESEWIGIMGFTPDRNPLVGPLDSSKLMSSTPVSPIATTAAKSELSADAASTPAALLNIDALPGYLAYAINTSVVHSLVGMRLNNTHSEYIAAGYTGHGMPVAFLAGKNIADLICGVASDPPIPSAYSPSRYNL